MLLTLKLLQVRLQIFLPLQLLGVWANGGWEHIADTKLRAKSLQLQTFSDGFCDNHVHSHCRLIAIASAVLPKSDAADDKQALVLALAWALFG